MTLLVLRQAWREWWCARRPDGHWWRPCNYRLTPARVCDDCGRLEEISHGQFYAQFGIHFLTITSMPALEPFRKTK